MNHGSRPPCQGILYTVKPGDTLSKIARRYNLTVRDIVSANPQISDPDKITVGQVICIPKVASQLRECAIVLALSREATVALPEIAGGVVFGPEGWRREICPHLCSYRFTQPRIFRGI